MSSDDGVELESSHLHRSGLAELLSLEKAAQIVGAIPVPAVISHLETHEIHTVNRQACSLFGYTQEQLQELRVDDITHPDFQPELPSNYLQCIGNEGMSTIKRYLRADGSDFSAQTTAASIDEKSQLVCAVIIETEGILELGTNLLEASKIDPLTGVLRREAFMTGASRSVSLRPNYGLLFIDLDEFKDINDVRGHDAGDAALTHVGKLLREFFRQNDLIGRYGGDEFIVLVNPLPDAAVLGKIAQKLATKLTQPLQYMSESLRINASIGAVYAHSTLPVATAIKAADSAMYSVKNGLAESPSVHLVDLTGAEE